uniref:Uncharacterized protein n=1 Tax=Pseudomonas phage RVTF4 TaxID=3236931 RepID=A0AB39CCM6_9VIRU
MMDDVYQWIQELVDHFNETGDILQCHYVPNLTSHSKIALEYEREFLKVAFELLIRLPNTVQGLTHITAKGRHLVMMFNFDDVVQENTLVPAIQAVGVDHFVRPIKIPKNKLSMTTPENTPCT